MHSFKTIMNTKLGSMLALDLTLESKHSNVVYTEVQSYLEAQESRECLGIGDQKKSPSPGFNIFVVELCITRISQCEVHVDKCGEKNIAGSSRHHFFFLFRAL